MLPNALIQVFWLFMVMIPVSSILLAPFLIIFMKRSNILFRSEYQNRLTLWLGLAFVISILGALGFLGTSIPSTVLTSDGYIAFQQVDISQISIFLIQMILFSNCIRHAAKRLKGMGHNRFAGLFGVLPIIGPMFLIWLAFTIDEKTTEGSAFKKSKYNQQLSDNIGKKLQTEAEGPKRFPNQKLFKRQNLFIGITSIAVLFSANWFGAFKYTQLVDCGGSFLKFENNFIGNSEAYVRKNAQWQNLELMCDVELKLLDSGLICHQAVQYEATEVISKKHTEQSVEATRLVLWDEWNSCRTKVRGPQSPTCFLKSKRKGYQVPDENLDGSARSQIDYVIQMSPTIGDTYTESFKKNVDGKVEFLIDTLTLSWQSKFPENLITDKNGLLIKHQSKSGACKLK